jgi:Kae1-associated kinase Bud32
MPTKMLFQGAEAIITKKGNAILKDRVEKKYRHPQLDSRIRTQRTRKELKLLEKASKVIQVPKILNFSQYQIGMEMIKGKNLAFTLDNAKDKLSISKMIGVQLAKLHNIGIIHGDLTTSNMIYSNEKLYFIDFGLGYESQNAEDKAVDLHVLKEALGAKHPVVADKCFAAIVRGYGQSKNARAVIMRLQAVEKRGRYKQQY